MAEMLSAKTIRSEYLRAERAGQLSAAMDWRDQWILYGIRQALGWALGEDNAHPLALLDDLPAELVKAASGGD